MTLSRREEDESRRRASLYSRTGGRLVLVFKTKKMVLVSNTKKFPGLCHCLCPVAFPSQESHQPVQLRQGEKSISVHQKPSLLAVITNKKTLLLPCPCPWVSGTNLEFWDTNSNFWQLRRPHGQPPDQRYDWLHERPHDWPHDFSMTYLMTDRITDLMAYLMTAPHLTPLLTPWLMPWLTIIF